MKLATRSCRDSISQSFHSSSLSGRDLRVSVWPKMVQRKLKKRKDGWSELANGDDQDDDSSLGKERRETEKAVQSRSPNAEADPPPCWKEETG